MTLFSHSCEPCSGLDPCVYSPICSSETIQKPAAGRNSFYLIDNWRKTYGFFVASNPQRFGLIERCSSLYVVPSVKQTPGRA
jgi:hypothetical protein